MKQIELYITFKKVIAAPDKYEITPEKLPMEVQSWDGFVADAEVVAMTMRAVEGEVH